MLWWRAGVGLEAVPLFEVGQMGHSCGLEGVGREPRDLGPLGQCGLGGAQFGLGGLWDRHKLATCWGCSWLQIFRASLG